MIRMRCTSIALVVVALGVAGVRAEPAPAVEARAVAPHEDAPYDPTGRRDPFRAPTVGAERHDGMPRTPLQGYELGQLRLVAVVYDTNQPRAVLEDSEGLGYIVKVGTLVGLNDGEVRSIERGRVVVEEKTLDFYGDLQPTQVVLELRTSERGK